MADEYQKPTHGYNSNVNEGECETEIKDRGMFDFLSKKKEEPSVEECKPVEEHHHHEFKLPEHHHTKVDDECEELKPEPYHAKVDDYEEKKPEHHHKLFGHHDDECKPEVEELTTEVEHVYISEPPCEEEEKKPSLLEKIHRSHSHGSSSSSSSDEEEEVDGVMIKKKKKSLKEKIQEKLHKDDEEDTSIPIEKCDEQLVHHHDTVHSVHEGEKKGLLEKLKEKLPGKKCEEEEEKKKVECAPIEPVHVTTYDHEVVHSVHEGEEKKGFMEKLKEKLPGKHHEEKEKCEEKPVEYAPVEPVHVSTYESHPEPHHEVKEEKKGFLEKIKEKFSKNDDECKDKEEKKETPAASNY
ncbi:hypothetical protein C5167_010555 [Papaver somniferum]|uniref:Dehydrin n=1 Tax=Papaver somniferum TaxID=3469 RepID=A0A4Y7K0K7_PAPSO|nr:dehydrin COR47-like [Papaver somniferum]RZC66864.1 hypothetical protein C5167_010555 [Papaver somniferum]